MMQATRDVLLGLVVGGVVLAGLALSRTAAADGQLGRPPVVSLAVQQPASPDAAAPQPLPAVAAAPQYCIRYWHHPTLRKICCGCCTPQKIVLEVQDPCCRPVQVPVCIPGCCTGVPHISTGRDILGRFSYTYEWCCGYKVDVVFRCRGDIIVHSWGR